MKHSGAAIFATEGVVTRATRRLTRFENVHILVVEDHPDTRVILSKLLTRCGHDVAAAETVQEALLLLDTFRFDVLVSDIGLPDGTGVDLMQQLSAKGPIFGIALTGFGMEEDIQKSHDGGFYHHLIKPVDLNKLDSIIQQVPVNS